MGDACGACMLLAPVTTHCSGMPRRPSPEVEPFCPPPRDAGAPGRYLRAQTSEQGLLGRDAVPPGEALRAQIPLAQNAVFEFLVNDFGRLQPELPQWFRRPPALRRGLPPPNVGAPRPGATHPPQGGERRTRPARPDARRNGPAPRRTWPSGPARARPPRPAPRAPRPCSGDPDARPPGAGRRPADRWPPAAPRRRRATRRPPPGRGDRRPNRGPPGWWSSSRTGDGQMAAKPSACRTCGSRGPGPRKPKRAPRVGAPARGDGGVTPFVGAGHRRRVSLRAR